MTHINPKKRKPKKKWQQQQLARYLERNPKLVSNTFCGPAKDINNGNFGNGTHGT